MWQRYRFSIAHSWAARTVIAAVMLGSSGMAGSGGTSGTDDRSIASADVKLPAAGLREPALGPPHRAVGCDPAANNARGRARPMRRHPRPRRCGDGQPSGDLRPSANTTSRRTRSVGTMRARGTSSRWGVHDRVAARCERRTPVLRARPGGCSRHAEDDDIKVEHNFCTVSPPALWLFLDMYQVGRKQGENVAFRNWHPLPCGPVPCFCFLCP